MWCDCNIRSLTRYEEGLKAPCKRLAAIAMLPSVAAKWTMQRKRVRPLGPTSRRCQFEHIECDPGSLGIGRELRAYLLAFGLPLYSGSQFLISYDSWSFPAIRETGLRIEHATRSLDRAKEPEKERAFGGFACIEDLSLQERQVGLDNKLAPAFPSNNIFCHMFWHQFSVVEYVCWLLPNECNSRLVIRTHDTAREKRLSMAITNNRN